jgi:acyl carrier protein
MKVKDEELLSFIGDLLQSDEAVDRNTALFSNGALDSAAMVNLIVYLEGASGKEIPPEAVTLDNFDTPAWIMAYLENDE